MIVTISLITTHLALGVLDQHLHAPLCQHLVRGVRVLRQVDDGRQRRLHGGSVARPVQHPEGCFHAARRAHRRLCNIGIT
eukprot:64069-Prorocentrum_minimum.AAC.2